MMKIKQKILVKFNYDIYFTRNLFDRENSVLKNMLPDGGTRLLIFLDTGVASSWPGLEHCIGEWFDVHPRCGILAAPVLLVPGGEQCKNDFEYHKVIARNMRITRLDRHSVVIVIGGGAVLDAVGFIAAITHRGIRLIRVPTTVLAQNDSGVGVKNGINLYGAKNYFGTFTPPYGVINDFDFLKTLDFRDWLAGIAEAFKVAIIKDLSFLHELAGQAEKLRNRDEAAMEMLIIRCAQLHAEHIAKSGDPFEYGSSRPLDFGHWSGHELEVMTGHALRHGEAVAIGLALDMIIARNRGLIDQAEYELVIRGLLGCGFSLWHPLLMKRESDGLLSIYNGLEEFRQHMGGKLTLIMPDHLGHQCQISSISPYEVEQAVQEMKRFAQPGTSPDQPESSPAQKGTSLDPLGNSSAQPGNSPGL
ncbi:MAG: 3-dehydroquinate synthase [bacterium]